MPRSSACDGDSRAQVEPLAALAAVFVVCVGLSLYAGLLSSVVPDTDRDLARPTLDRVHDRLTTGGVTAPDRLDRAQIAGPAGYRLNVTASVDDRQWHAGPTPPVGADDTATRATAVRVAPGRVDPGRLRVVVWS